MGGRCGEISPQSDVDVPWLDRGRVHGEVPCNLSTGSLTLEGGNKEGGGLRGKMNMTGRDPRLTRIDRCPRRPSTGYMSH